jgi:O-antigen/teichoic acid export membrane protein
LISAGFGPEWVPQYQYNGRLFEMAIFVVQSASVVSLPKITQWIASPENAVRERGLRESLRLNKFQTFLGCCGAFFCLQINDWFVRHWLGKDFQAPLSWQIAFAATLAITAASMMGSDLAARCSGHGIRFGGLTVLGAGLLNFILAFVAMKRGAIWGIALATSIAISVQALLLCWFSSRQLKISWWRLSLRNGVLALVFVGMGVAAKKWMPVQNGSSLVFLILFSLCVVFLAAWLTGIRLDDLREEKRILQSMFARTKQAPDDLQGGI